VRLESGTEERCLEDPLLTALDGMEDTPVSERVLERACELTTDPADDSCDDAEKDVNLDVRLEKPLLRDERLDGLLRGERLPAGREDLTNTLEGLINTLLELKIVTKLDGVDEILADKLKVCETTDPELVCAEETAEVFDTEFDGDKAEDGIGDRERRDAGEIEGEPRERKLFDDNGVEDTTEGNAEDLTDRDWKEVLRADDT